MWLRWILELCGCIWVFSANYLLFYCEKVGPVKSITKGQWRPVSPEQVKRALCWKGNRKETSKRLFEALLEQVIGRNLWPVGFPGYQQKRWLSVLRNKRNPRGLQGLPVTLPYTCISELREEWISSSPGIKVAAHGPIPSPNSSAEGEGCQWKQNWPSDPSSGHSKDFRFATHHGLGCQESYNMSETL